MQTEGETHKRILMQVENLTPRRAERKQTPKTHSDCMTCLASVISFSVTVFVSLLGGHVPEIRFRKITLGITIKTHHFLTHRHSKSHNFEINLSASIKYCCSVHIYMCIHSVRQNFAIITKFS